MLADRADVALLAVAVLGLLSGLGLLAAGRPDAAALAFRQFERADNMTDRQGALTTLVNGDSDLREAALDIFYNRYAGNSLVLDKWFQTQALSTRDDTPAAVAALAQHPDFTLANPNRARSLIGAFAVNQRAFNQPDGAGYRFLADQLIALDRLNPQTAATAPAMTRTTTTHSKELNTRSFLCRRVATYGTMLGTMVSAPRST